MTQTTVSTLNTLTEAHRLASARSRQTATVFAIDAFTMKNSSERLFAHLKKRQREESEAYDDLRHARRELGLCPQCGGVRPSCYFCP